MNAELIKRAEIKEFFNNELERVYSATLSAFGVPTGDIDPLYAQWLRDCQATLADVVSRWVEEGIPKEKR